jgi:hypothetical protein
VTFEDVEEMAQLAGPQSGVDGRLGTTDEAARRGDRAGVALLEPGDPQWQGNMGYRSEWQSEFRAERGVEYWYGVSVYLPADWHRGRISNFFNDRIVFQFHEGTGGEPAVSLHINAEAGRILVRRKLPGGRFDYMWSTQLVEERWYDWAFNVKWSRGDDGFFHIYLNRRLVYEHKGSTLVDGSIVFAKWGIYGQPTRIFFDEVRIAEGPGQLHAVSP